ncbi:MAG: type II toxin-antitoxin system VapC family toxin [Pseudonocardia sp.]
MHLDTHVVVWLYAGDADVFPPSVQHLLDTAALSVSPMVALELTHLHEIGRTSAPSDVVLTELRRSIGLTISEAPFPSVVETATALIWTRDPFDRLISAQAVVEGEMLLTKDRRIREHLELARWDAG